MSGGQQTQVYASAPWGAVRGLTPDDLRSIGTAGLLIGGVELSLRPGLDVVDRLGVGQVTGGLPVLVEPGVRSIVDGFGVNAGRISRITAAGIEYRNGLDGSAARFTPEWSLDVQQRIGATLLLAPTPPERLRVNERLTTLSPDVGIAWLRRAADYLRSGQSLVLSLTFGSDEYRQALIEAARDLPVVGIASDGALPPHDVPPDWVRIFLGADGPEDVSAAREDGVAIVESPAAGRLARQGQAWLVGQPIDVGAFPDAERPLDSSCDCAACRYALGYLAHLVRANEILGETLLLTHNLRSLVRAANAPTSLTGNSPA